MAEAKGVVMSSQMELQVRRGEKKGEKRRKRGKREKRKNRETERGRKE